MHMQYSHIGAHGIANHLDQILDAAALLKDRADIVFLPHGRGHEKKKELQDRARREGLKQVAFLDPMPKEKLPT